MDLMEITDNLIDHLILKLPTEREHATEAAVLSLAWLTKRGFLRYDAAQQVSGFDRAKACEICKVVHNINFKGGCRRPVE